MAQYKLSNIVRKTTTTGKAMIRCTAGEENDVTIWSNFVNFANLKDGDVVEGELETKQNGQYVNKTLNMPRAGLVGANRGQSGAFRGKQMEETMAKKQGYIQEAQDNKGLSIKISGTMRDAVLCALAGHSTLNNGTADLEASILRWRKWLWAHYDDHEKFPPFFSGEEKSADEQYEEFGGTVLGEPEIPWS